MNYPGSKNGAGVYQNLINLMPKHDVYIEAFLGSGAVLRNKREAKTNIGVEIDEKVIEKFWEDSEFEIYNFSAFGFFRTNLFTERFNNRNTLIYCDPPYLKSVRSSKQKIYNFEFMFDDEHIRLLNKLKDLDCNVMISGYESKLYNEHLPGWRKSTFGTSNRAGKKTIETVWMNYPEPRELHDYSYLGDNFRERERIMKKRKRLKKRLLEMDKFERLALIATVEEIKLLPASTV
jgi:DNA adenine methylase